jgi:hypothetical protein
VRAAGGRHETQTVRHIRENAQNCADKAENTKDEPSYKRFKRMEAAWLALAEEQDWLDGEISPVARGSGGSV